MNRRGPTSWVPFASFVLAIGLAVLAGPARPTWSLRSEGSATACTVSIDGPEMICFGKTGTYTANGIPANGTCKWTIPPELTIEKTDGCTITLKAGNAAAEVTIKVAYEKDKKKCGADKKVKIDEVIIIPVCPKRVRSSDGKKGTAADDAKVKARVEEANKIWEQCCIRWEIKKGADGNPKIEEARTDPADDAFAQNIPVTVAPGAATADSPGWEKVRTLKKSAKCLDLYFVNVFAGAQGLSSTPTYPPGGGAPTGEDDAATGIDDAADASTLGHELGHQVGLPHVQTGGNLMDDSGKDGGALDEAQCKTARENAKKLAAALK